MIVRTFHLVLATHLVYIVICQNARSYDTSDWVPITQKTDEQSVSKRAAGRVLNLDAPAQKFFPEDDYLYKKRRPNSQQHLKQKERSNVPKYENGYKFEGAPVQQNGIPVQYFANQEIKLPNYEQPPPLDPFRSPPRQPYTQNTQTASLNTREKAPSPNAPNLYEQYNVPLNASSLYQSLNPGSINQELIGALQFQQNIRSNQGNQQQVVKESIPKKLDRQKGEVQLVYVPLENLKPNQPITQDSQTIYRQIEPQRYDNLYPNQQVRLEAIENDFVQQALQAQRLQQQIQEGQSILLQPTTTPTAAPSKKRKAHQPPLAVYIEGLKQNDVTAVLDVLKHAKSIAVQDSIQANSPQIFIGPSSLSAPDGYTKYPLPYLNNLNGNRVERKIDQLPFFVAPLSFKTPPGYSKIPLPSPHVGSVVISNKEELHGKRSTPNQNQLLRYEVTSPSVTQSALVDSATPQTYLEQDFYNQGHFLAPKPELIHYDSIGDYRVPASTYSPESFFDQYNSNFRNPSKVTEDKYQHNRGFSPSAQLASSTVRYSGERDNEIRSSTRNSVDGQQFPADVQQIRTPSRTKSYTDTQYFDGSLSELPTRSQQDYQVPSRSTDRDNKIKHSSKSNHKTRYEPITTTLDTSYNSRTPDVTPIDTAPKATPSPIPQVSAAYTDSDGSTPQSPDVNPLELAINEFELYQINSQFQEKPRVKNQNNYDSQYQSNTRNQHQDNRNHYREQKTERPDYKFDPELHRFASTPASILRDSYVETTVRPTTKSRRRGRPTKPTTTTTPSPEKDNYTVLEEFTARQPSTPYSREPGHSRATEKSRASEYSREPEYSRTPDYSGTPEYSRAPEFSRTPGIQYATEIEEIPARVHVLSTSTPTYGTVEEVTKFKSTSPRYQDENTEIEDIPARVYSLNVNDNVQYTEAVSPQNQQLDQNLMDQQILQGTIKQERPQYETDSHPQQFYGQEDIQPLVHNRGQSNEYLDGVNEKESNKVSAYDSSLEDPSVRSLLRPNLLVPTTTDDSYSAPKYLPTTEEVPTTTTTTTTTERYVETTTRGRGRGRQRGGSRYDSQTTRRTVSRRRPAQSYRTTTESSGYSAETGDVRKVNSRQRSRTRGRVTPNTITERVSTTENEIYNSPTSEAAVQILTHPSEPQYSQYEQAVDTQTNVDVSGHHHRQEPSTRRPFLQYENTASTSSPIVDYRISHQAANRHENNVNQNSQHQQVETQSDARYGKEDSPRETVRVRGRIRGRPKPTIITSTEALTTRRTTTPRPAATEEEEEFYGFFRQPNFSSPPTYLAEEITTTERPRAQPDAYQSESSFPPEQPHGDHRLEFDNTNYDSTTLRFVGEIVPKYQTTSREVQIESETEAPRPRIRGRVKVPQRHSQRGSYEDSRPQEQATRRTNVIRSRGKAHFRLPDNLKKEKDEDEVAGGNYPSSFFQNKQQYTTRAPGFQITVDPLGEDDGDQAPHPSLYRPSIVRPEEWHEASEYDASDKGQTSGNTLENEDYQQNDNTFLTTTSQPFALPIQASTEEITTVSSEENYRETTKAVEDVFEAINNNFEKVDETFSDPPKQKKRRKGVWKLVKQRPVDFLAGAESQNYYSVLNSYQEIQRVTPKDQDKSTVDFQAYQKFLEDDIASYTTAEPEKEEAPTAAPTHEENTQGTTEVVDETTTYQLIDTSSVSTTTPSGGFFDTIYEMFGMSNNKDKTPEHTTLAGDLEEETPTSSTTNVSPTFPEEMTEVPTSTSAHNVTEQPVDTTTDQEILTTNGPDLKTSNFEVEPWEMRAVRTSTSTEVSHETEICYKGKCVKSRDRKKRL